jgi:hypothetical protein
MKKEFYPYYISRAGLSIVFSLLVFGVTWKAGVFAVVLLAGFLGYLHSGWFEVNLNKPFFPLRRDENGQQIQRKALIAAVVVGILIFVMLPLFGVSAAVAGVSGSLAFSVGVLTYFVAQVVLFMRI